MDGFGSSRRPQVATRSKAAVQSKRTGCIARAACAPAQWPAGNGRGDGDKVSATNMCAEHDRLHLTYRVRIGGEWEDVDETVRIVRMPCRFGGARPYFVCPGVVNGTACGRRVAKLYGPGRYFLCRHCYRLAYAARARTHRGARCGARPRSGNA